MGYFMFIEDTVTNNSH